MFTKKAFLAIILSSFLSMFVFPHVGLGAQIRVCKKLKRAKSQTQTSESKRKKKIYCSIAPKTGLIGDYVDIKDRYNYTVAVGVVVRHTRSTTMIVLKEYVPNLGSMTGYPVMIRSEGDQNYWGASTAPL